MKDIRKRMEQIVKETFRDLVLEIHGEKRLTQTTLGHALLMDRRSVADLESGQHMCGELTILFILIYLNRGDPLLEDLRHQFEEVYNTAEVFA